MRAIRNVFERIVGGEFVLGDILHPLDVVRGPVAVCDDQDGRPIVIDEISIRAALTRMDPLATEKVDATTISVSAWGMAEAIDDRYRPIHQPIPNRIAGAPLRDRKGLRRLRDRGYASAAHASSAAVTLNVPESVAGWIGIRHRKAAASLDGLGW